MRRCQCLVLRTFYRRACSTAVSLNAVIVVYLEFPGIAAIHQRTIEPGNRPLRMLPPVSLHKCLHAISMKHLKIAELGHQTLRLFACHSYTGQVNE